MTARPARLGYLVSHPIQYQAPLLKRISEEADIDLTVLFCSDVSLREFADPEFGTAFSWDVPLLEGYRHEFLPSVGDAACLSFWEPFNYGISAALKRLQLDALWIHGWGYFSHLWAARIARSSGIRVLLRGESSLHLSGKGFVKQTIKDWFLRNTICGADALLAIGSLNRDFYLHYGAPANRVFLMPYAVDNDFFQRRSSLASQGREQLRDDLQLVRGRPVILYASKMTARKRARDLLEAYIRLSPDGTTPPDAYLLLVGDGEERLSLEAIVQDLGWDTVRFLGFKNQTELPAYFDLCDVFVLPSFNEPWALVINEVMNAGRAVIVSDQVGCAPDLVRHGENGFIFKAGDVQALSQALVQCLGDRQLARQMGERSRKIVEGWGFEQDVAGLRCALASFDLVRP
jgi:glycosyltransferase involved in cell wall biosynthesis